jgi:amino acid adenylation domain-containing protein
MRDLESRISALSPAKRALLERRLHEKAEQMAAAPIQPRSSAGKPPMSFGQERLWFLDRLYPGNPAYNISHAFQLDGTLDEASLRCSLAELARRHESLRTSFAVEGDEPVQIIRAPGAAPFEQMDLTGIPMEHRETEAFENMSAEAARSFDLVHEPLWRVTLQKLEPNRHLLLLVIHHIVSDAWSMDVFCRELFALYEALSSGQPAPLAELPIQYADFALWQRRSVSGDFLTKQLNYWREQLKDLPTLEMPTDRSRPATQIFAGAIHRFELPPNIVGMLKSLSREEGATLFMTLLAAFQVLLQRYTGQDDVVVGSPIAGRTRAEVEGLIGFFVNMLVLRTNASGDPTFREFLGRARKVSLEAYTHQDIPFEKLVAELQPQRDPSRNPLFQVVFALQNASHLPLSLKRLKVTEVQLNKPRIRFDLEILLEEADNSLSGHFVYNTALFEVDTISRMAAHFQILLESIAENPDQRLSQLPLLTESERRQLLVDWNSTATNYPRDACIHELFEAQADANPAALAVAFGNHQLTYRQLDELANFLAHKLRTLGVGPDVLVGVCAEQSVEMIVGYLAILKAGGGYVPLDPSYPHERLAFMLRDANIPVVLIQEKCRPNFPQTGALFVCLDEHELDEQSDRLGKAANAVHLAYVIYTSGTTGQPRGVAIAHRSVVRLVHNANYIQLSPADRIAQASAASFDAATFEIWGALLNGASLIGIPKTTVLSPKEFAYELRKQKISTLFLTTSLFNQMAGMDPTLFGTLRYLLIGGEACDPNSVRRVLQHGPPQHLLNAYGPTESTTFATSHRIVSVEETEQRVPIGRPISNTQIYILDRFMQPVPVGVTGEIYIGGDGLAREYFNRPDITSERFVPDPFHGDSIGRLYKTGDFARYLPGGSIDFMGRRDEQVKIRGFRVELQGIETVLSQHPEVMQNAVIARRTHTGELRLVAYVLTSANTRSLQEELRSYLREKLPEFMVPAAFMILDSFPLTRNGKLDREALPEPKQEVQQQGAALAEPRTSIEESLAGIWSELLGIQPIGIHDSFFDLGGHSLMAIQLIARIERRFGKTVPVAALFQFPTIGQLASLLIDKSQDKSWLPLIPIQPQGRKIPFFWIHGDYSNAVLSGYLGPDQPVYGMEHQAQDGRAALYTTVDQIAEFYLRNLRSFRPHGPYLLGGYSFGAVVAFEMAQKLNREYEQVPLLFMLDPPGRIREQKPMTSRISMRNKFRQHQQALKQEGPAGQFVYLLPRISGVLRSMVWGERFQRLERAVNRLRCRAYIATGRLLPLSLRSTYILDIYTQALGSYAPSAHPGKATLFKAKGGFYMPPLNWPTLVSGGIEIHEGLGGHLELRQEPHICQWAEVLRASLDRVHTSMDAW